MKYMFLKGDSESNFEVLPSELRHIILNFLLLRNPIIDDDCKLQLVPTLPGKGVTCLSVSDTRLLVGHENGKVSFWTFQETAPPSLLWKADHKGRVNSVKLFEKKDERATRGISAANKNVIIWDLFEGIPVATFELDSEVLLVSAHNGTHFLTRTKDAVRLHEIMSGEVVAKIPLTSHDIVSFYDFYSSTQTNTYEAGVIVSGVSGIQVWYAADLSRRSITPATTMKMPKAIPESAHVSPDNSLLFLDTTLYDLSNKSFLYELHSQSMRSPRFLSVSMVLYKFFAGTQQGLHVWDLEARKCSVTLTPTMRPGNPCIAADSNISHVFGVFKDGKLSYFKLEDVESVPNFPFPTPTWDWETTESWPEAEEEWSTLPDWATGAEGEWATEGEWA